MQRHPFVAFHPTQWVADSAKPPSITHPIESSPNALFQMCVHLEVSKVSGSDGRGNIFRFDAWMMDDVSNGCLRIRWMAGWFRGAWGELSLIGAVRVLEGDCGRSVLRVRWAGGVFVHGVWFGLGLCWVVLGGCRVLCWTIEEDCLRSCVDFMLHIQVFGAISGELGFWRLDKQGKMPKGVHESHNLYSGIGRYIRKSLGIGFGHVIRANCPRAWLNFNFIFRYYISFHCIALLKAPYPDN